MKKHIFKLLAVVGMAALCCIGCSKTKASEIKLEDGVLTWDAQKGIDHYEVTLGDNSITCEDAKMELAVLCKQEGEYQVSVSTVSSSGKEKTLGTLDIIAKELEKPAISVVKKDNGETCFIWKTQKEAGGYIYDFNDGYGGRDAEVGSDGTCSVVIPNNEASMFTVSAKETSKDNVYYIGSTVSCRYVGEVVYDLTELAATPFFKVCDGTGTLEMTIGTTLDVGVYDLEITFRLTNTDGQSLTGNGAWGRRVAPPHDWGLLSWFCTTAPYNSTTTYVEAEGTLKPADETVTYSIPSMKVNKYGETSLTIFDFLASELIIVEDVKCAGRSVIAKTIREHDARDSEVFDVSQLESFLAVYEGTGVRYSALTVEQATLSVPMKVKDGVYSVEVNYQIMSSNGDMVSGNGVFGRAVSCVEPTETAYYCEYPISAGAKTRGCPYATEVLKDTFTVKVKDGKFDLILRDFAQGEIFAVKSIKRLDDGISRVNISGLLKNNPYVYEGDGDWTADSLAVITTKTGKREQVELEITYITADKEGYAVIGNGLWGRRFEDDTNTLHFICNTSPHEDYPEAAGSNNGMSSVTKNVLVTLNKKGKFYLIMSDFNKGDLFIVTDVKYQGESILAK